MLNAKRRPIKPALRYCLLDWCPGPESNRHALRRGIFLPLRLSPPELPLFVVWSTRSPCQLLCCFRCPPSALYTFSGTFASELGSVLARTLVQGLRRV